MKLGLTDGAVALCRVDHGSDEREHDAEIDEVDTEGLSGAVEPGEDGAKFGEERGALDNGKAEQHEREAGHKERRCRLAGVDDVDGSLVVAMDDGVAAGKVGVARDDGDADPHGELGAPDKAEDAGEEQRSVDDGVEHFAEPAYGVRHTRNLAVEPVGGCRDRVDHQSDIAVEVGHEEVQEYDRENEAQKRDEVYANYNAMKATEKAAKAQYEMARNGAQKEDKEMAAAMVNQAKGAVAEVSSYINETILIAQSDGEVTEIFPKIGELVGTGAPIMNISMLDKIWATFNVREDLLKDYKIGQEIEAFVPALEQNIKLKIYYMKDLGSYAAWKATKTTGQFDMKTFEVRAEPLNKIDGLRPGMSIILEKDN